MFSTNTLLSTRVTSSQMRFLFVCFLRFHARFEIRVLTLMGKWGDWVAFFFCFCFLSGTGTRIQLLPEFEQLFFGETLICSELALPSDAVFADYFRSLKCMCVNMSFFKWSMPRLVYPGLQWSSLFRPRVRLDTTHFLLCSCVHCFSLTTDPCLVYQVWKETGNGCSELDSHSGRNDLAWSADANLREVSVLLVTS